MRSMILLLRERVGGQSYRTAQLVQGERELTIEGMIIILQRASETFASSLVQEVEFKRTESRQESERACKNLGTP